MAAATNNSKPSWMLTPPKEESPSTQEYSSDSESQFTYENIGGANLGASALGPALSMDSVDSSVAADDELMLSLKDKHGATGIVAESPSLRRAQRPEGHVYPEAARTRSLFVPDDDDESADASRLQEKRGKKDSPIFTKGYNPALDLSMNSFTDDIMPLSPKDLTKGYVGGSQSDEESQPFDETMEDSIEQDLDGFAEELEKIKRDIGRADSVGEKTRQASKRR